MESSILCYDILTDTLVSVISKVCFCKMLIFGNPLQSTYMSTYSYKNISTNKYDEKELMKVRKGAKKVTQVQNCTARSCIRVLARLKV